MDIVCVMYWFVNAVVFLSLCETVEEKPRAKQNRGERAVSVLAESPVFALIKPSCSNMTLNCKKR